MAKNPIYFDLLDACRLPGCPVCRLSQELTARYLSNLFYENVNDRELRAKLRASLGFCKEHAWLALEPGIGDSLGVAIIYHDVLGALLKRFPFEESVTHGGVLSTFLGQISRQLVEKTRAAVEAISPKALCPACQQRDNSVDLILSVLIENLRDEELTSAFVGSAGLCLPHLSQALERARDEEDLNDLLVIQRRKLQELHDDLAELIRKNDYRFRSEELGRERDSWRRVIGQVAGGRPVSVKNE